MWMCVLSKTKQKKKLKIPGKKDDLPCKLDMYASRAIAKWHANEKEKYATRLNYLSHPSVFDIQVGRKQQQASQECRTEPGLFWCQ